MNIDAIMGTKGDVVCPPSPPKVLEALDQQVPAVLKRIGSDAKDTNHAPEPTSVAPRFIIEQGTLRKGIDVDFLSPPIGSGSTDVDLDKVQR